MRVELSGNEACEVYRDGKLLWSSSPAVVHERPRAAGPTIQIPLSPGVQGPMLGPNGVCTIEPEWRADLSQADAVIRQQLTEQFEMEKPRTPAEREAFDRALPGRVEQVKARIQAMIGQAVDTARKNPGQAEITASMPL